MKLNITSQHLMSNKHKLKVVFCVLQFVLLVSIPLDPQLLRRRRAIGIAVSSRGFTSCRTMILSSPDQIFLFNSAVLNFRRLVSS